MYNFPLYKESTWYKNPNTPSTWNYMSVHVKGIVRFVTSYELEEILSMTSLYFEDKNQKYTTVFDNLPLDFKQKHLN